MTGSSAVETAMPAAATSVPPSTTTGPASTRTTSPIPSRQSATPTAAVVPTRRAVDGASNPPTAKQSTGIVVSTPAHVDDAPSESRAWSSSGPTLVIAGRRFAATSAMATTETRPRTRAG